MRFLLGSAVIGLFIAAVCASPLGQVHQLAQPYNQESNHLTRRQIIQPPTPDQVRTANDVYNVCMRDKVRKLGRLYLKSPPSEHAPRDEAKENEVLEDYHFFCIAQTVKILGVAPRELYSKDRYTNLLDDLLEAAGSPPRPKIWARIGAASQQAESQPVKGGSGGPSFLDDVRQNPDDKDSFHSINVNPLSQLDAVKGRVMGGLQRFSGALGSVGSKQGNGGGRPGSMPMQPAFQPMPKGFAPI